MNPPQSEILNPQSRDRLLSTAFHDVETVVGNHPRRLPGRLQTPRRTKPRTRSRPGRNHGGHWWKKATTACDDPGFLAAQVFAIAAETGWPEERILFMLLARLAQYQHCLLRRNGVRTHWSASGEGGTNLREQLETLRVRWNLAGDSGGPKEAPVRKKLLDGSSLMVHPLPTYFLGTLSADC